MENEYGSVSLDTIGHGVARELFDRELAQVLKNIEDPNADARSARKIILTVTIVPNENRHESAVKVACVSRLAGVKPHGSTMFVVRKGGKLGAFQHNLMQQTLLDSENNVVNFEGSKDA